MSVIDNKQVYFTKRGEFLYPFLNVIDRKHSDGKYKVTLALDAESVAARELMELIDEAHGEHVEWCAKQVKKKKVPSSNLPYQAEVDDDDEPTGRILFKFWCHAVGRSEKSGMSWENKPGLYDSRNQPITGEAWSALSIGNGTIGRVGFQIHPYPMDPKKAGIPSQGAGVSLRLIKAKLLSVTPYVPASGFGDEDDLDEGEGFDISRDLEIEDHTDGHDTKNDYPQGRQADEYEEAGADY